ncbi:MAG: RibD family protein [Ruminococcaceae bacterium]|nr:RibD family protein [Oscillospiraceae bacterium]
MTRPYLILHMLISPDGKITGKYMEYPKAAALCEEYYRIHREYRADAFLCGRVTMEGSFTGGVRPPLEKYEGVRLPHEDFVAGRYDFYAVSVDPHGRLGWYGAQISDEDPGYDGAHVIEVLTDDVCDAYLAFLREKGISYVFCGKDKIDVPLLCRKLFELFGIRTLLVEGGGLTDSLFLSAELLDELSLVMVPVIDGGEGVSLFEKKQGGLLAFEMEKALALPHGGLWLNYKRKEEEF